MSTQEPRLTRTESLHRQIARHIQTSIEAGVLRDGESLDSTRELAKRWDVSVFTINEAMRLLADQGLVVNVSRSKRVVKAPDQASRNSLKLNRPQVFFIGGFAGSGKTELGRILARETGWPMLDKDTLTRPVVEAALDILGLSPNDRESDSYLKLMRPREYESLMAAANENVSCGNSAIVTAPFLREFKEEAWLDRTQANFDALNAVTTFVWVYCDADSMHTYIRHRGAARDAVKLGDWPKYLANVDVNFRPQVPHVVINNCSSGEPLQGQARALLKSVIGSEEA